MMNTQKKFKKKRKELRESKGKQKKIWKGSWNLNLQEKQGNTKKIKREEKQNLKEEKKNIRGSKQKNMQGERKAITKAVLFQRLLNSLRFRQTTKMTVLLKSMMVL